MDARLLWQRLRVPVVAALVVLASLAARATWEQVQAFDAAVAAERAGQLDDAIEQYRWTLRWYTPWGPKWQDAADALQKIAQAQEPKDPLHAMRALDALRSGLIAGRHLWQPRADLVAWVNQKIPAVMVQAAVASGDKRDSKQLEAQFTRDYARPVGVGPLTSAGVAGGFLLWLGGLLMLVRRGLDDNARITRTGWRWLGTAVAGFAIWALALWLG